MQAAVLKHTARIEDSPLEILSLPDPTPQRSEVRLKVHCCAICRTDLHVIEGDLPEQKRPIIPGHQIVGVFDMVGPDCRRLKLGQRVGVAWLRHTCGACDYCSAGRENLCDSAPPSADYHADGGYAGCAVVPEDFAYTIPDAFNDADAAPLLWAGIIGYRALKRSHLPDGGRLAIFGFGSSAHVVLQIARHRSCEVFVVTRGEGHRELARQMGAAWVGERASDVPEKVDSAIIFAPAGELVPPALGALRRGGTLALAGIHMSPIPEMNYERHLFYERNVHSVTSNTRDDGNELLAEASEIPIRPHTTKYSLQDANRALQDLKADRINGTGVLVVNGN